MANETNFLNNSDYSVYNNRSLNDNLILGSGVYYYENMADMVSLVIKNIFKKYTPAIFRSFFEKESLVIGEKNNKIDQIIDEEFTKYMATEKREKRYRQKGRDDYFFPEQYFLRIPNIENDKNRLSAKNFIKNKINKIKEKNLEKNPLKILDLGTGNGRFLLSLENEFFKKVDVKGISAFDTRNQLESKSDLESLNGRYFVGNSQKLFEIEGIEKESFDVIVSSCMLRHSIDPIKDLMNAYEALKVGGEMLVDHFAIRGLETSEFDEMLKKIGYVYELKILTGSIDYFWIKKTKDRLNLPIKYKMPPIKASDGRLKMQYEKVN